MKSVARALLLLAVMAPLAGCVVAPAPGPAPRYGAHWVPGHYNGWRWVPGHWT